MIDAAFDHIVSDPKPTSETPPTADPITHQEEDWVVPAIDEFGANPIYDTGN